MGKLIELLNQYNIELHGVDRAYKDGFDLAYEQEYMRDFRVAYLISKKFLFIKWLVDNDKIDRRNVKETNYGWEFNYYWTIPNSKRNKEIKVERLLMILSIQDNPIEFLISVLK